MPRKITKKSGVQNFLRKSVMMLLISLASAQRRPLSVVSLKSHSRVPSIFCRWRRVASISVIRPVFAAEVRATPPWRNRFLDIVDTFVSV